MAADIGCVGKKRRVDTQELWLQKAVKTEVLEKHMAGVGITRATRRGMCDELMVAHVQIRCQPDNTAKKFSAAQKALRVWCNESGCHRSSCCWRRKAFQHYHPGIRRVDEGLGWPTHTVRQEAMSVQWSSQTTKIYNHQNTQYNRLLTVSAPQKDIRVVYDTGSIDLCVHNVGSIERSSEHEAKHIRRQGQHFQHPARLWRGGFTRQGWRANTGESFASCQISYTTPSMMERHPSCVPYNATNNCRGRWRGTGERELVL